MATVSILGLGYMGLPMAALVAEGEHTVIGVDVQQKVVDAINAGEAHFEEAGLAEKVAAVAGNTLTATLTPQPADIFVIAVPTPFVEETKAPDMVYVRQAAESLAPVLKEGDLVILESTSPIGATEQDVRDVIEAANPALKDKVLYAFCPERAIPGDTLRELIENDRCVGGLTPAATEKALSFYKSFVTGELIGTTSRVAEMVKLVENTSRDVNIALANELAYVCDELDLDVWEVISLAERHPRVHMRVPGTGVGGHCIAVDPWFIINAVDKEKTPVMQAARKVNDGKPMWVVEKIRQAVQENPHAMVACMGLAFKPNVDDLRTSPSCLVTHTVRQHLPKEQVLICEPHIKSHPEFALTSQEDAVKKADILVFLTAHDCFKEISEVDLLGKVVIDPSGTFAKC